MSRKASIQVTTEGVLVGMVRCKQCGKRWIRKVVAPKKCPKCGSRKWNQLPMNATKGLRRR